MSLSGMLTQIKDTVEAIPVGAGTPPFRHCPRYQDIDHDHLFALAPASRVGVRQTGKDPLVDYDVLLLVGMKKNRGDWLDEISRLSDVGDTVARHLEATATWSGTNGETVIVAGTDYEFTEGEAANLAVILLRVISRASS